MTYDYKAARLRIQLLTFLYRRLKHQGADEMELMAIEAQVDEMEREIAEAHRSGRAAG